MSNLAQPPEPTPEEQQRAIRAYAEARGYEVQAVRLVARLAWIASQAEREQMRDRLARGRERARQARQRRQDGEGADGR